MKDLFNRRKVLPLVMLLQMFNEGGAGEGAGGAGAGAGDGGSGGGNGGAGGSNPEAGSGGQGGSGAGGEQKPFATFPDEASFMARVGREAQKQFGTLLKGLGFDKQEDLKAIIDSHNTNLENQKTELQKAQDKATKADNDRLAAIGKANGVLLTAEAKIQASALGVKPERINHMLKLANMGDVKVEDGVVDVEALKTALGAVLTDFPELKGTTVPHAGGGDFGGGGGQGGKPPLTMELIRNMSTDEAEARIDEITQFLSKNNKQ